MSTLDGPRIDPDDESARELQDAEARLGRRRGPLGGFRARWNELPRQTQWAWMVPVVILMYALPYLNFFPITTEPGNDWPISLFTMAIYALVAVGLNVVVGYAGLLDLGYVAFFAVGSYTAALFTSPNSPLAHIPYLWTLPLAMVITATFGVILGVPTLRLRGDYLAIVTLGFGEIVRILATIIPAMRGQVGFSQLGHPPGGTAAHPLFSNSDGIPWYWLTLTIIIIIMLLVGNLERSRVGRAWIAIREDEDAAETMGVPTFKYKVWAFAIGAMIGGLSGALFGGQIGFVNNQKFDVQTSMLFVAAVVLGGAGNKVGAVLGGVIVAYIPQRFTELAPYKYLIFGVVLVILMIYRSQGLIPAKIRLLAYVRRALRLTPPPPQTRRDAASTEGGAA